MRTSFTAGFLALGLLTFSSAHANPDPVSRSSSPVVKAGEDPQKQLDEMMHRELLEQTRRLFEERRKAIAAIKTPQDVLNRQKVLREFFWRSLGDLPERTPLNPRVVGTLPRDGYRVEKVIFESRPNHHVTANLYVPDRKPPFPGVLLPCGHSDNGKAYASYQRMAILLARNGMAVFCFDPIGQGERDQLLDTRGKPVVRGTTEHTMEGIGALLVGRQLASYRIWDGIRALDYLAGRPEVDPSRLGCTGNSGGGTMTAYLMALDDRISVAAPSCFITSLERLFTTIGPQDAEQHISGQVAAGMEHADYATLRAPKPTLLVVGTRDYFDIQGSWDTYREVKLIYGRLGFGERVDLFESDEQHGFTQPRRIATARWMRRWLLKQDDAVNEPDFPVATDAELQCTRTGQVLTDFQGLSVFDLNRRREQELRIVREKVLSLQSSDTFASTAASRLGLDRFTPRRVPIRIENGTSANSLVFEFGPGISVPALEVPKKAGANPGPTHVLIGPGWREKLDSGTLGEITGTAGSIVVIDPRGMGWTAAPPGDKSPGSPFGRDWTDAFLAMSVNRPLLGQRVARLLDLLETLHEQPGGERAAGFHVVGSGPAGLVALHAALLDGRGLIKKVTLHRSLISWSDVVQNGLSRDQLASVVPGILESYDLPDLAARLAQRALSILEPVDALGVPVSQKTLEATYAGCVKAFGREGRLELRAAQGLTPSR
jgi:cephalosporin-C deacetylase-like acetyl esterase